VPELVQNAREAHITTVWLSKIQTAIKVGKPA